MKARFPKPIPAFVIVLVAFGVIALALGGYLTPLSRVILNPLISAQTWIATRFQTLQNILNAPADVSTLRQENLDLKAEISRLQVQIIEIQQELTEAQVLASLVDYARSRSENRYVAAAVIGRDPSPFLHYVIINRGSDDGFRKGMPVVTQQGLVGQISAVTAGAARVQLINDPGSTVNVFLQQSETEAVLVGNISGEINLELIPQAAKIQTGDIIVTSGYGGNYPPNLLVGQVSTVRSNAYDLFQSASVQPAVDFSQLEIVLVITNFQPIDITPLMPNPSTP
jgi:rod shape-determining protein MreC